MTSVKSLRDILPPQRVAEVDAWVNKYPPGKQASAVMAALRIVQEEYGYLTPELMDRVADYLAMPPIAVYEVATFYSMYQHKPCGRHAINVCTNISCKLRGSAEVMQHLKQKLAINPGEVTPDGRFSLGVVECLGACAGAPAAQIDKDYHENLTPAVLDAILEQYQ